MTETIFMWTVVILLVLILKVTINVRLVLEDQLKRILTVVDMIQKYK